MILHPLRIHFSRLSPSFLREAETTYAGTETVKHAMSSKADRIVDVQELDTLEAKGQMQQTPLGRRGKRGGKAKNSHKAQYGPYRPRSP
jgi:hypothetical protein